MKTESTNDNAAREAGQPVTPEVAREIIAALKEKEISYTERDHEKINYDAATERYLPSTYTYTIHLRLDDARTGNAVLKKVCSVGEIDAALAEASKEIKVAAKRTRSAIAAERRAS